MMNNLPLSETYRPTEFDDIAGLKDKAIFETILNSPSDMSSLLLFGPQGTGKTTSARILVEKLKPIDVLKINGSDTTGVDTIREKVYNFMTSQSFNVGKPRLIWIEEFDYMSASAFAALRAMMETHMKNARFICTCNYINKIPAPIQSRFTPVEFKKPPIDTIVFRLKTIADAEMITVSEDVLLQIASQTNGDVRAAVNNLQILSSNETRTISDSVIPETSSLSEKIYDMLIKKEWTKLRYEIPDQNPDYYNLFVDLDKRFFESDLSPAIKAQITEILAQGQIDMTFSFNQDICFAAVCSKIIKSLP